MIRAHDLTKVYHLGGQEVRALDGVDIELGDGEFLGVVGSSGSGKSTLLNLLAGMDTPDSGRIETPDGVLSEMSPGQLARYRRERVGMVFQTFHLIPHRTALQNVETALIFSGVPRGERRRRALETLERLGLGDRLLHRPADLSGGEQQRVALARALVKNPSLLLADEPTGNLDQQNARQIGNLLEECNRRGIVIVLVTHDEALADRHAHRSIRLRYGRISDGPLDEGGGAS